MAVDPSTMGGPTGVTGPTIPNTPPLGPGIIVQAPVLMVLINGAARQETLLGATITYGFDIGIASASVEFTAANIGTGGIITDPAQQLDGVNYFDKVEIYAGTGTTANSFGLPSINGALLRFTGLYLRTQATMWPGVFEIICKGNLYRAAQYFQSSIFVGLPATIFQGDPIGSPLVNFLNSAGTEYQGYLNGELGVDSHDGRIVQSILEAVPNLNLDPSNIHDSFVDGGPSNIILLSQFDAIWPPYRSAWDQIQLFDQAFLGYRTYESLGGSIYRTQVYGYPQGDSDFQFTEGQDIWEAEGTRDVEQLINASYVEGGQAFAGASNGGIVFTYVPGGNPFQGNPPPTGSSQPVVEEFRSPFIEISDILDPDRTALPDALRAEDVANWRLSERNRELVNVQLVTFWDWPIGAGRTIAVNIPHAAVTEPVWVQRVEIRVQSQPMLFQQTIFGLGGGLSGFGPNLSADPPLSIYP